MSRVFRLNGTARRDPEIARWMQSQTESLGDPAQHWFEVMRECGGDVREVLHDDQPTACIADVAFAYVAAFKAHVNVGFFLGAELQDPHRLLDGNGKFMRHVKLRPGEQQPNEALCGLIRSAYEDMKARI